jgi:hypothetical protein
MAVDYTTLFTRLGTIAKAMNDNLALHGTTLPAQADAVLDEYEDRRDLVADLQAAYAGFRGSVAGWNATLKSYADRTLGDLQKELNAPSSGVTTILPLLVTDMIEAGETVDASAVGTPAVSYGSANVGSGNLVVSKRAWRSVDDERILAQRVELVCVADGYAGASAGGERFSLTGYPKLNAYGSGPRGDGVGPVLTVADAANVLSNGTFESFTTTDVPDGWSVDAGTAATHTKRESSNVHRGSYALKLDGDGSQATVTLSQALTSSMVQAGEVYCLSVWLRKSGTVGAGSNLAVRVTGTGFSTVSAFNADPSTLTTAFAHYTAFISVPVAVPADFKAQITWTSANAAGASADVLVDDVVLARATEFGHLRYALFAGSANFAKWDTFAVVTTNDGAGTFQAWFGRFYDALLPSDAAGGETIDDALAE